MDLCPVQQPLHVRRLAGVPAQQPVVAQHPQIPGTRGRRVGRRRDLVGIGQALGDAGVHQFGQFVGIKAQQPQIAAGLLQRPQFGRQQAHVPLRPLGDLVVGDPVRPHLLGGQVGGRVDGHLFEPELLGRLVAGVADDDDAVGVHDNRLAEAELADGGGDRLDRLVVETRVARVGADVGELAEFDLH